MDIKKLLIIFAIVLAILSLAGFANGRRKQA